MVSKHLKYLNLQLCLNKVLLLLLKSNLCGIFAAFIGHQSLQTSNVTAEALIVDTRRRPHLLTPSNEPAFPSKFTCVSRSWTLPADVVALEGPDVYKVENSRLQANQLVRAAVPPHWDLSAGALRSGVAQHVAIYFGLDTIPWKCGGVLCHFFGDQVDRSVDVWRGRRWRRNKWRADKRLRTSRSLLILPVNSHLPKKLWGYTPCHLEIVGKALWVTSLDFLFCFCHNNTARRLCYCGAKRLLFFFFNSEVQACHPFFYLKDTADDEWTNVWKEKLCEALKKDITTQPMVWSSSLSFTGRAAVGRGHRGLAQPRVSVWNVNGLEGSFGRRGRSSRWCMCVDGKNRKRVTDAR